MHILMILTFLAAVATLLTGVFGMGSSASGPRSTRLMALRVALCLALLGEILIYVGFVR
ncbi:MAG: hypothetical protein WAZ18_05305 [Alphaproteobacteria bacterium]